MNYEYTGKVALVTGGGKRRVGNVVAQTLAERGCDVALHYHTSQEEAERTVTEFADLGVRSQGFQADLTDESQVEELVRNVQEQFGRVDILITAHSVWSSKALEDITKADLMRQLDVDVTATFLCCQKVGLLMAEQESGGSIVTICDWAIFRPYQQYAAYFAAKGSIPTMTRSLAVELASRNTQVRVNCILPGPVMVPESVAESEGYYIRDKTLLKRLGSPDHVAHAVRFLIENDFVTGISLPVDGGRTLAE